MQNFEGKRLLVLGGTNNAPDIQKFVRDNKVTLVVAGTHFSKEIEAIADEKYFINILSDSESFSTLMVSKQFFRNRKYLCDWAINPEFKLAISNNVRHNASE